MSTVTIDIKVSAKDKELVGLLSKGLTTNEISKRKKISAKNIQYNIEQLKTAYNCPNTVALVAFFLRNGLIE